MKVSVAAVTALICGVAVQAVHNGRHLPRRMFGMEKLDANRKGSIAQPVSVFQNNFALDDAFLSSMSKSDIIEGSFTQPLDHFDLSNNVTFPMRYWYSLRYYNKHRDPGTPVPIFVLDSGETDAVGRLPYLDHGIVDILAEAFGGIGVVLEHRYYGRSFPRRSDLGPGDYWGTDEMRWLNNKQALEDSANFVKNMQFEGVTEDITAPAVPVISYGGSYPGARSAHLRVLYPDLFYGAIASSAVVEAIEDYSSYFFQVSRGAEVDCSQALQAMIAAVDSIIAPNPLTGENQPTRDDDKTKALQNVFGVKDLERTADFANLLSYPLGSFQALNWDDDVSSSEFAVMCSNLTAKSTGNHRADYAFAKEVRQLTAEGEAAGLALPDVVYRYARFLRAEFIDDCLEQATSEECFGSKVQEDFINATDPNVKAWQFQVCTTWGYFTPAPRVGDATVDPPILSGPKLVSTLLDLPYTSEICRTGFPDGEHFKVPAHPNVTEVNEIGGFSIAFDRLAIVDGQYDPWREATAHSETFASGGARADTLDRPFKLIADCWHHCDENSLPKKQRRHEPARIKKIHAEELEFVGHWLKSWSAPKASAV